MLQKYLQKYVKIFVKIFAGSKILTYLCTVKVIEQVITLNTLIV